MAGKRNRAARQAGVLACVAFAALLTLLVALPSAGADPTPTLTIQTPAPNGGTTAEGPVGTNVTINGQGFMPTDTVAIGYASVDQGCATGDVMLNPSLTGTVGGDGSFTFTFPWPAAAPSIGATYFICATDTTPATPGTPTTAPSAPVHSTQTFKVDAGQAPSITLTPVPGETSFTIGGQIALTAENYQPSGKSLKALLLKNQYSQRPADLTDASVVTLATADLSTQLMADATGAVSATLVLPSSLAEGNYWLYLVSSDGSSTVAPSLIAGQQIKVQKPAATPTPSNTPKPAPSATPPASSGGKPVPLIAGLGGLSLLFLILGVVFLASAAALPRQPR